MAGANLNYVITGHDKSASKALRGVADEAGRTGKHLHGIGVAGVAAGAAIGAGLAVAADKVIAFAGDSITAFSDVGMEIVGLQRIAGGTAEDMSHLAAAAAMTGTDVTLMSRSVGIASKNLVAAKSPFANLGFAIKDAHGKSLNFTQILPKLADKFKAMPNGVEKTALALKLFGRGGLAMLPILNKGSAGLKDISKESDKLGTTLSGKDLAAVKENTIAKRKFGEVIKGLQIQLGRFLLPILTKVTEFLVNNLGPAVAAVSKWVMENLWPAFKQIAQTIGDNVRPAVEALVQLWVEHLQPAFEKLRPVLTILIGIWLKLQVALWVVGSWIIGKLVPILATVVGWLIDHLVTAITDVWVAMNTLWGYAKPVWDKIYGVIEFVVTWIRDTGWPMMKLAMHYISAAFTAVWTTAKKVWDSIWQKVEWVFGKISGAVDTVKGALGSIWDGMFSGAQTAFNWLIDLWNNTIGKIQFDNDALGIHVHAPILSHWGDAAGSGHKQTGPGAAGRTTRSGGSGKSTGGGKGLVASGVTVNIHTNAVLTDSRGVAAMMSTAWHEAKAAGYRSPGLV